MSFIDPIGEARRRYKKKLLEAKKAGQKLEYYDIVTIKGDKVVRYRIPVIEIHNLEYGPRDEHPGIIDSMGYPDPGMGAPAIGSGPGPKKRSHNTNPQLISDDDAVPAPGSGIPGTPLYPPPGDGDDSPWAGEEYIDPVYAEAEERELISIMMNELELEMIKPGRNKRVQKVSYPAISLRGDDSLLNLDETLMAMFERQSIEVKVYKNKEIELIKKLNDKSRLREECRESLTAHKLKVLDLGISELEKRLKFIKKRIMDIEPQPGEGFKVHIEEDDLRYYYPKIRYKVNKDALIAYVRDVSGSITKEHLKASYDFTRLIDLWINTCYPKVERVYIAHNYDAWEETLQGYKNLQSDGGTRFSSAYELINSMIKGEDYETKLPECREIRFSDYDVYIVQMTDGFGLSNDSESQPLIELMPHLTRFCYLEERIDYTNYDSAYKAHLESKFSNEFNTGVLRTYQIKDMNDLWGPMKAFFGRKNV